MATEKEVPGSSITRRNMLTQVARGAALVSVVPFNGALLAEASLLPGTNAGRQTTRSVELATEKLTVSVNPATSQWSAGVKGSDMQLNNAFLLPAADTAAWAAT